MKKLNQEGVAHLAAIFLVVILAVAGVGYYVYEHDNKTTKSSETETQDLSLTDQLPTDILTVDKVKELVTTANPNASVATIELDKENGVFVYKVKLADGSHLFFNAQTGAAVTDIKSDDESDDGDLPDKALVKITFDQAREIAMTKKTNGVIEKIKLDGEDGKPFYKVTFTDGTKMFISAVDGTITKTKTDSSSNSKSGASTNSNSGSHTDNSGSDSSSGSDGGSDSGSGKSKSSSGGDSSTTNDDKSGSGSDNSGSGGSGSGGHGSNSSDD